MRRKPSPFQLVTGALALVAVQSATLAETPSRLPRPSTLGAEDFQDLAESTPVFAEGGIEVVRERYPDGKTKIEKQVVLDLTGNYVNHGEWRFLNPKGGVVAEGHFDMGKRIGPWMRWYNPKETAVLNHHPFNKFKPPFQSQANFVDDQMDGEWLILDSAQRKCMQVSLSAGKRHGTTTIWLPNGNVYSQATYELGVRTGDVLEPDKKGELKRVATYIEGRSLSTKTAKGRGKHKKSEEQFLGAPTVLKTPDDFWALTFAEYETTGEELRHGPSTIWFDNGQLQQQGFYQHGKKAGTFTFYYENGQVAAAGEYKDDLPDGMWVWSHRNGQKATIGQYRAGQQVGEWRWWQEDGTLASQKSFLGGGDLVDELPESVEIGQAPEAQPLR